MNQLDPLLHPFRPDLAAAHLEGRVQAARFAPGERRQVSKGIADLHRAPDGKAPLDSQLLYGEEVDVYDEADGWAWVQNSSDGYVGYLRSEALRARVHAPTHSVTALRSYLLPEPDFKAPPLDLLSLSSPLAVVETRDGFCRLAGGGWIHGGHLAPLGQIAPDYVATALAFLGTPYLWGGRSSLGLDCSALIQIVLARAGIFALRDTYMQEGVLGDPVPTGEAPRRGDLIFLPDHVAIALDAETVLHANAFNMAVTTESLAQLEARSEAAEGQGITGVQRPVPPAGR